MEIARTGTARKEIPNDTIQARRRRPAGLQLHEFTQPFDRADPRRRCPHHIAATLPSDEDLAERVFAAGTPRARLSLVRRITQLRFQRRRSSGGVQDGGGRREYPRRGYRFEGDVRAVFCGGTARATGRSLWRSLRASSAANASWGIRLWWSSSREARDRCDIGELFSKIDKNHDGRVSKPELILALRRDEALALRLGLCAGAIKDDSRASLEAFFRRVRR